MDYNKSIADAMQLTKSIPYNFDKYTLAKPLPIINDTKPKNDTKDKVLRYKIDIVNGDIQTFVNKKLIVYIMVNTNYFNTNYMVRNYCNGNHT